MKESEAGTPTLYIQYVFHLPLLLEPFVIMSHECLVPLCAPETARHYFPVMLLFVLGNIFFHKL